jgi:CRISPR-associated helicase Cas3/CRISPR-associated endonuclease Cas3-HD
MILDRDPISIQTMLNPDYIFYAHTKNEVNLSCSENETIAEHTERCLCHFKNIVREKEIENIFLNFAEKWLKDCNEEELNLFWDMLINTITFHDIGKINPLFQKDKMKNPQFAREKGNLDFGSKHSIISAIFYLAYYLPKSKTFQKEIKRKFRLLAYINAYIISKHHGVIEDLDVFVSGFLFHEEYGKKFQIISNDYKRFLTKEADYIQDGYGKSIKTKLKDCCPEDKEKSIFLYAYEKLLYSLLIASDYYATTQYNDNYIVDSHGTIENMKQIMDSYEKSKVTQNIRSYQNSKSNILKSLRYEENTSEEFWWNEKDINTLRCELFLDAEQVLKENCEKRMFYLEAPTGSGKSNVALNLSFQLMEQCSELKKIWYIYPFNTLVEQNVHSLEKIFGEEKEIMEQIRVVNSITPINKISKKPVSDYEDEDINQYVEALLDRQFFHYPITLSTHVTLFDILFGEGRESGFGFYQLVNSIVVLDEIQSYRNEIWTEIISFLKTFAEMLNMKIIIMSATLPDLDLLSMEQTKAVKLIENRERYFLHPLFKNRVELRYELLEAVNVFEELTKYVKQYLSEQKKVLVEFLFKTSAEQFYRQMCAEEDISCKIRLITGDDNSAERNEILKEIENEPDEKGFLLVSTSVIEAGVDLQNMEIGFKNISTIDSEEQFMGRVNRSCKRNGIVYFFCLDNAKNIYRNDVRLEQELTLESNEMRKVLVDKTFNHFYQKVFARIRQMNNVLNTEKNINDFFIQVGRLNNKEISNRMQLIEEDKRMVSVFLARELKIADNHILSGKEVWKSYEGLLKDTDMGYAEKKVKLSMIRSKMSYFIYQIQKNLLIAYNQQIGEMYYIEDGEQYFEKGKLNREKLKNQIL